MIKMISVLITAFFAGLVHNQVAAQQNIPGDNDERASQLPSSAAKNKQVRGAVDTIKSVMHVFDYELPADKNALIKISNTFRNIEIKTWPQAKVRIVGETRIDERKNSKISQEELLEASGLFLKSSGNRVEIQSRVIMAGHQPMIVEDQSVKVYNRMDTVVTTVVSSDWDMSATRKMTIYVPDSCKLDLDNKNTNVLINADIDDARFKLSRSNLDARNFRKLRIWAEYYNINISDVQEAELELENGNFTGGVINNADIDSKGSEIDYEGGQQLYLRSQNDRITIDEITKLDGNKHYGDLRIGKLLRSIDIEGSNADIKIRMISAGVDLIKIENQYADLRLPVKNTPNFAVTFKGNNSTVFAPFKKELPLFGKKDSVNTEELRAVLYDSKLILEKAGSIGIPAEELKRLRLEVFAQPVENRREHIEKIIARYGQQKAIGVVPYSQFTATSGDTSGKHTRFNIICHQCSVDFK